MDTAGNQSQAGGGSLRDGPVLPGIVIAPAHPAHERVFDGVGDSAVKTGQDFVHAGESIWHGITSIF
jgi:hypothetical protein